MNGAICRKLGTGCVSVVILFVGGFAQYGLSVLSDSTQDSTAQTILTTASSLIVTIFNVILMLVLGFLTKKERNETETEDQTVLMVKVTLFQFLNAGIFVIIAEITATYSTFSLAKGVCSQITLIMILNAFIPNATLLFL
jgi:heme/copper-type cytochrome/quinol oxidase subunit 2